MKINKYITITIFTLTIISLIATSCSSRKLPHRDYRGMPPRGPKS